MEESKERKADAGLSLEFDTVTFSASKRQPANAPAEDEKQERAGDTFHTRVPPGLYARLYHLSSRSWKRYMRMDKPNSRSSPIVGSLPEVVEFVKKLENEIMAKVKISGLGRFNLWGGFRVARNPAANSGGLNLQGALHENEGDDDDDPLSDDERQGPVARTNTAPRERRRRALSDMSDVPPPPYAEFQTMGVSDVLENGSGTLKVVQTHTFGERNGIFDGTSVFGLTTFPPTLPLWSYWSLLILIWDGTYTAFAVPIEVAFVNRPQRWARVLDSLSGFLTLIDMFGTMHCGFVIRHAASFKLVQDGRLIALQYITSYGAFIDLMSLAPMIWALLNYKTPDGTATNRSPLQVLRLLRLVRFVAVLRKISKSITKGAQNDLESIANFLGPFAVFCFQLLYLTAFLINFLGCMLAFTAYLQGYENSWMSDLYVDRKSDVTLDQGTGRQKLIASWYGSLTTISTIGYGDISAKTTTERLIFMLVQLVGVCFFGALISNLTKILSVDQRANQLADDRRRIRHQLVRFSKKNHVPKEVAEKARLYYEQVWNLQLAQATATEFYKDLPESIWAEIADAMVGKVLRKLDAFSSLPDFAVTRIAGKLEPLYVAPLQEVAKEGKINDAVYILRDGVLEVTQAEIRVGEVRAPAIISQLALANLLDPPTPFMRTRGIRAKSASLVFKLAIDDLKPLLLGHPHLFAALVTKIRDQMAKGAQSVDMKDFRRTFELLEKTSMAIERRVKEKEAEDENGDSSVRLMEALQYSSRTGTVLPVLEVSLGPALRSLKEDQVRSKVQRDEEEDDEYDADRTLATDSSLHERGGSKGSKLRFGMSFRSNDGHSGSSTPSRTPNSDSARGWKMLTQKFRAPHGPLGAHATSMASSMGGRAPAPVGAAPSEPSFGPQPEFQRPPILLTSSSGDFAGATDSPAGASGSGMRDSARSEDMAGRRFRQTLPPPSPGDRIPPAPPPPPPPPPASDPQKRLDPPSPLRRPASPTRAPSTPQNNSQTPGGASSYAGTPHRDDGPH